MSKSVYTAFVRLLSEGGYLISPAEIQGALVGRSCAGAGLHPESWLAEAQELLANDLSDAVRRALLGLQEMTDSELNSGSIQVLTLLLPDDEASLQVRTQALGEWCRSFLSAFGMASQGIALTEESREVLEDLAAIAQIQESSEGSEAAERYFAEVVEYVRVAPLLLYAALAREVDEKENATHH